MHDFSRPFTLSRRVRTYSMALAAIFAMPGMAHAADWLTFAHDNQHTALSPVESQPLVGIKWDAYVDTQPAYSGSYLFLHYGSPLFTAANTVVVPIKDTLNNQFKIDAYDGVSGTLKWSQTSDYTLPPNQAGWPSYSWTPPYGPTIGTNGNLYYAGAGGTIYSRNALDSNAAQTPIQLAFYGMNNYTSNIGAFNANLAVTSPITADNNGNIYFGYFSSGASLPGVNNGVPIGNGIARISSSGVGSYFDANTLTVNGVNAHLLQATMSAAPALSHDGSTLYVVMSDGDFGFGRLVAMNSTTLQVIRSVALTDPFNGQNSSIGNISTSSPMIGPDGDVYFGVTGSPFRGYLQHFNADLTVKKTPGAFGWDMTPSVVPASMVPSYHGTSAYLLMCKYNDYNTGQHKIAILDPNDTQIDTSPGTTGATVMKEILTLLAPTPNPGGGFKEWCINTAVVDPATNSVLVNNEDGKLYRWDLTTNTLSEVITLTEGRYEAYTPTSIGPDGTVYAINDAELFAVGVPTLVTQWDQTTGNWSQIAKWSGGAVPHNGTPVTTWYDVTIAGGAVTLDVNAAVHSLTLNAGSLSGTNSFSMSNGVFNGAYQVTGAMTVSGVAVFNNTAHAAGTIGGTGTVIINTGATMTSDAVIIRNLTVFGTHTLRANSAVSKVVKLTIGGVANNWTGTLDLKNNSLIIQSEGSVAKAAALVTLQNQILSGSANNWSGPGLTSSSAAANAALYGVGLFDNALLNKTNFAGGTGNVDSNSILVAYALLGDTNLDGLVNSTDLDRIASHWNMDNATNWAQGDLNNDRTVDSLDVTLVIAHWDTNLPFTPLVTPGPLGFTYTLVAVPEPTTLSLLALTIPWMLRRSSRRRR